jgi:hypothetical protein
MSDKNYTPYQQKLIRRYYDNIDTVGTQRLAELVTDLYLAEGKKKEKVWASVASMLEKLKIPQQRIDHILAQKDPVLVANLVKELQA